jgi:hypothetical protein
LSIFRWCSCFFILELFFKLIYSVMRGVAVLFHSNSNINSIKFHCWHFFLFVQRAGVCYVSFREHKRLVFSKNKVLSNKYYPNGWRFFDKPVGLDLFFALKTLEYLCSWNKTKAYWFLNINKLEARL